MALAELVKISENDPVVVRVRIGQANPGSIEVQRWDSDEDADPKDLNPDANTNPHDVTYTVSGTQLPPGSFLKVLVKMSDPQGGGGPWSYDISVTQTIDGTSTHLQGAPTGSPIKKLGSFDGPVTSKLWWFRF